MHKIRAAVVAVLLAAAISQASHAQEPTVTPAPTAVLIEPQIKYQRWDGTLVDRAVCYQQFLSAVIVREYFSSSQYSLEGDGLTP
jgi:hypothetical protein